MKLYHKFEQEERRLTKKIAIRNAAFTVLAAVAFYMVALLLIFAFTPTWAIR